MRSTESRPSSSPAAWHPWQQRDDRKILGWALAGAIVLHLPLLVIGLPDAKLPLPPKPPQPGPTLERFWIKPPEPPEIETAPSTHPTDQRTPVPVAPQAPPEPVPEHWQEADAGPSPIEISVLERNHAAPPAPPGPRRAGVDNVTNPVLIPESKVTPHYPELARRVRLEGRVILEAVIRSDGVVSEIRVLQVHPQDLGFAQAAVEAVEQWRYEPARQDGRPVDVYFTVVVTFELR